MWNRKAMKRQGKAAFKRNYRKSVLTALFLALVLSGSFAALHSGSGSGEKASTAISSDGQENGTDSSVPNGWTYKEDYQGSSGQSSDGYSNGYSDGFFNEYPDNNYRDYGSQQIPQQAPSRSESGILRFTGRTSILVSLLGIAAFLLAIAVGLVIRFFVLNPLEIGSRRFFLMNLKAEPAEVKEIGYAFDHSWKNAAYILFFRDLYLFLWSLLFIVPGIIKFYEYRMIPYLLAENPDMKKEEVFAESRKMMQGQKMSTFMLDLSFLGWVILSVLTAGIVGIFYTNPYVYSTNAALYAHLRYENVRRYGNPDYTGTSAGMGVNPEYTASDYSPEVPENKYSESQAAEYTGAEKSSEAPEYRFPEPQAVEYTAPENSAETPDKQE